MDRALVDPHLVPCARGVTQGAQATDDVGDPAVAFLGLLAGVADQRGVEAESGHDGEAPAVGVQQVDRAPASAKSPVER